MFSIKGDTDKFESVEEFVDNLSRGGEIEFKYAGQQYSITHPEGKLNFFQIGNEASDTFFESIDELLKHPIDNEIVRDIITKIQPTFRCF